MDPTSERAIADYDALLRDESLRQELEERFLERMRARSLTFGGRVLCPFPRPNLVPAAVYEEIRGACRGIFGAIEKAERTLGPALWDRVGLRPEERELVAIDPGFGRSSPLARLDSFLTPSSYQFVELNAETPAGASYAEALGEAFLEIPLVRRFQERWRLRPFRTQAKLLETLLRCYREAGGREERPTIAVVDYEDVPTRVEHHMAAEFFRVPGLPLVRLRPARARLRARLPAPRGAGHRHRLQAAAGERAARAARAARRAARGGEGRRGRGGEPVPLQADPQEGHLRRADRRRRCSTPSTTRSARRSAPTCRGRGACFEGRTLRHGVEIDLPRFVLEQRERAGAQAQRRVRRQGRRDRLRDRGRRVGAGARLGARRLLGRAGSSGAAATRVPEAGGGPDGTAGRLRSGEFVVDLDPYVFDGEVEGFLTRLSATSLANVTSGGGQVPSFLVEPAG